jgi:peroxiredoxin
MGAQDDHIRFLADPDARFARAYGVDKTYDDFSLGLRTQRFSMIVHNGKVASFRIVKDAAKDAEQLLEELKEIKENQSDIASLA